MFIGVKILRYSFIILSFIAYDTVVQIIAAITRFGWHVFIRSMGKGERKSLSYLGNMLKSYIQDVLLLEDHDGLKE
jgi:hypothetical protein